MLLDVEQTIVALASPLAPALRAIIRISGPHTKYLLKSVLRECRWIQDECHVEWTDFLQSYLDSPFPCYYPAILDLDWHGRWLECGVYYWPTERSFTGQPCAELHLLGSPFIADKVVERLLRLGARPAEPGEFSLRSFLAGKLDLVQAEAILGVIESVAGDQLQWALSQLGGNISQPIRLLREELMSLVADLEAGLDFVEEDIEFITSQQLLERVNELHEHLAQLGLTLEGRGAPLRPLEVALAGLPNSGKSSLFNALLAQNRAITSDQSGTTRDLLSARMSTGVSAPYDLMLIDTPGIEHLNDQSARAIAQSVLKKRVETCDIVLLCLDLSDLPGNQWVEGQLEWLTSNHRRVVCIGTKFDLLRDNDVNESADTQNRIQHRVSILQPDSIQTLRELIQTIVQSHSHSQFTEATHRTAIRCRLAFRQASDGLARARALIESGEGQELIAHELHGVVEHLGSVIGEIHNDDILGRIFERFCIGK